MSRNVNTVAVSGNLTRDPELRTTSGGLAICRLGIAVNESFKKDDEWQERANFFDVTVFGGQAEACSRFLTKGRAVVVQGKLRYESWEGEHGKRSKVVIVADYVQFLNDGRGGEREPTASSGSSSTSGFKMDDDGDFETARSAAHDISDDDIPFLWRSVEFEDRYEHGSRWTPPVV